MAELVKTAPERVLAVYAHPDDPEISCGGTLAAWAQAGSEVHVLTCTRGDKGSSDPAADRQELVRRRAAEVAAAAEILGVAGHQQLPIDDGEVENSSEVRGHIVAAIRHVRPHAVICPDPTAVFFGQSYFNHHDHRIVGWATLDAIAPAAGNPHYFPEAGPAHQVRIVFLSATLDADSWVDIGSTIDTKVAALSCHESQLGDRGGDWVRDAVEARAAEGARACAVPGVTFAEGFRRLVLGD
jgi:LmbE family N-acetylglucosaminyl deacetylase